MRVLRELRKACGMSQEELAAASGIDRATISLLENGRRKPTIDTLESLARALNCEMAEFFPRAQTPLFDPAERVKLSEVASDAQIGQLDSQLRTLYRAWEAGELPTPEYSVRLVDTLNAALDTGARAAKEAG